mgnify:CR=1 FL=1
MWKLLCGDNSAASYLGYIADAATDLLTGKDEQEAVSGMIAPGLHREKSVLHYNLFENLNIYPAANGNGI